MRRRKRRGWGTPSTQHMREHVGNVQCRVQSEPGAQAHRVFKLPRPALEKCCNQRIKRSELGCLSRVDLGGGSDKSGSFRVSRSASGRRVVAKACRSIPVRIPIPESAVEGLDFSEERRSLYVEGEGIRGKLRMYQKRLVAKEALSHSSRNWHLERKTLRFGETILKRIEISNLTPFS